MSRLLLALALIAGADAYLLAPIRPAVTTMRSTVATMATVEEAVTDCLESGCSIDDVSVLIDELKRPCQPSNPLRPLPDCSRPFP